MSYDFDKHLEEIERMQKSAAIVGCAALVCYLSIAAALTGGILYALYRATNHFF